MRSGFVTLAAVLFGVSLQAQDTRIVTEPHIPQVCATLRAQLAGPLRPEDEGRLDTARLQKGIDDCTQGKALRLDGNGASDAFLTGPLRLKAGVTLLVDRGVTLYGSRDPKDYETSPGSCGLVDEKRNGCRPLISATDAADAGIMGDGVIDGRGGAKLLIEGQSAEKSWWDLAEDARKAGHQEVPRLIQMDRSDRFTLYRITLKNAAFFHVTYNHGDGLTVWGLKIDTPQNARNTDGVDPSASKNITVTHSFIRTGDDNIAIKGGDGPVTNMTVAHNHFYWGHGMSIGSETMGGVSAIRVTDLSLDGPDNALRIKSNPSRGGLVHDVVYEDVCIRNSRNPILLDTAYNYPGSATNLLPMYQDITFRDVRIAGGGTIQFGGLDATHRVGVRLDGVVLFGGLDKYKFIASHADVVFGPGPVNFGISGPDTTVRGTPGHGSLPPCAGKFVAFPSN